MIACNQWQLSLGNNDRRMSNREDNSDSFENTNISILVHNTSRLSNEIAKTMMKQSQLHYKGDT
jgi:hypothetical protein